MTKKYHSAVFMPIWIQQLPIVRFRVIYTHHAKEKANAHNIQLTDVVSFAGSNIVVAETDGGIITSLLVRLPYSRVQDVVFSFANTSHGRKMSLVCKTVYLNNRGDSHTSLNTQEYDTDEN